MNKKERYSYVIQYFSRHNPDASTELIYSNPYELIVAVILSAQCTDKRVNLITPALFKKFPDFESLSKASFDEILNLIKSCSYPNNKARHLTGMAKKMIEDFNGKIPATINELQQLPGIGRKTANVIAAVIFNQPFFPVDTHVFRVANRIGLTTNAKTPLATEKQLTNHFPDELIPLAHHWLILHGRYTCKSRKPLCEKCGLAIICKYYQKNR
jgi:endonuclease-3